MCFARPLAVPNNPSRATYAISGCDTEKQCSRNPTNLRPMRRIHRHLIWYGLESVPCVIPRACSTLYGPPIWRPFCFPCDEARQRREIRRHVALSSVFARLNCKQGYMLLGGGHDRVNVGHFDGDHPHRLRHGDTRNAHQPGSTDQVVREAQHPVTAFASARPALADKTVTA